MVDLRTGIMVWTVLVASATPTNVTATETIAVINQSSLASAPDEPFKAVIRQGRYGPELAVTGPVAERTSTGERVTEAVLEIIVVSADGTQLWSGYSAPLTPGRRLDFRVAVQPLGVLDGTLIAEVVVRDGDVWTAERREREAMKNEREARDRAEAERQMALKRQREARARVEAERQAALKRERHREAEIKAHGWPKNIERAVIERVVVPGMTTEQVSIAWGLPTQVNETIRASGVSQQWVYSSFRYVYFENGRVTAIQTSR